MTCLRVYDPFSLSLLYHKCQTLGQMHQLQLLGFQVAVSATYLTAVTMYNLPIYLHSCQVAYK